MEFALGAQADVEEVDHGGGEGRHRTVRGQQRRRRTAAGEVVDPELLAEPFPQLGRPGPPLPRPGAVERVQQVCAL